MDYVIANTKKGKIRGFKKGGINIWRGIPYALPPIGKLRYKSPVEVPKFEKIHDALEFGPISFQRGPSPIIFKDLPESEDCLYLNVMSPDDKKDKKPVIFWIHGGAFLNGSGSMPIYDGTNFVKNGDIVVVTINYRLGPFGFLKLSQFGNGYEDNLGLLDQIAALKWVKENIEAFGGDQDNITIMGESAGAKSVNCLLASPKVNKLFSKAILQSGNLNGVLSEGTATNIGLNFIKKLNIDESNIENLERVPIAEIMKAADELEKEFTGRVGEHIFQPFLDEKLFLEPLKAAKQGVAREIPILIGTNHDEGWLFSKEKEKAEFITDTIFWKGSVHLAESQSKFVPVYMYRFDYTISNHPMFSKSIHALEIPFVFNNLKSFNLESEKNKILAGKMQKLWISFVKTGKPELEDIKWPTYDSINRSTLILNNEITVVNDPEKEK
ncbi:carboxylesterase/lipase family protein [Clostridium sp. SHJSY1]|uniref:carboxylesterase/lipase family protein n=1 Tax=Clostridium sp. SHJSY1 TaxID=2942483 RepID=UPI002876A8FE|nr:carboxylesterase/lipase family protein [Clostridium sp. SHJSY1]MDS0524330.1 carboxylesterase/lipase family protein [Clostridium sp. SHJSY1]